MVKRPHLKSFSVVVEPSCSSYWFVCGLGRNRGDCRWFDLNLRSTELPAIA